MLSYWKVSWARSEATNTWTNVPIENARALGNISTDPQQQFQLSLIQQMLAIIKHEINY